MTVHGYALGVYFTGLDANRTEVVSVRMEYTDIDRVSDSFKLTKEIYDPVDCSGSSAEEHIEVPRKCWVGGKETDDSDENITLCDQRSRGRIFTMASLSNICDSNTSCNTNASVMVYD